VFKSIDVCKNEVMKAVRFHEYGGAEVLRYEDVPDPVISEGEVLVRVKACALNHLDIWGRIGIRKLNLPHISGSDISGTIQKSSDHQKELQEGAEVIVNPGIGCGRCEKCLSGADNLCRFYTIIGYGTDGGYAELVKVQARNIIPKPERMDFVQASSIPLVFLTAYHMLVTNAKVQSGETVLVLAAGSGVGIAAIQVAKAYNANVIATAGNDSKLRKAIELGADYTINHYTQDIVEETMKYSGNRGADIVIEHVGKATWDKSIKALTRGGRLVTCGATSGPDAITDLRYIYSREITIRGTYMGGSGEMHRVLELFQQRRLRPVVDRTFPLSMAREAQERMERSEHFGKIVLTI
jgi:NADPH:quinone reductase-like Zn-dependent oxidoreductase